MLYEMLTCKVPFAGGNAVEVIARVLEREPAPLSDYMSSPAELQRIISKALKKNRDERYQTIKEMLVDLKRLRQELEFAKLERSATGPTEAATHPSGASADIRSRMSSA